MSQEAILENLNMAYADVEQAVSRAKRASLLYEVFMSDAEHKIGKSKVVDDIDDYFNALMTNEKAN